MARVDGHALLPPGYLKLAAQTLIETGADDAGDIMPAAGVTTMHLCWGIGILTSPRRLITRTPTDPG